MLLTKDGLEFLKASQNLLANLQHEVDAIKQTANKLNGSFVVMGDIATHDNILRALFLFSERYPLIDCKFVNGTDPSLLESGAVDVSITPILLKDNNLIQQHLFDVGVRLLLRHSNG